MVNPRTTSPISFSNHVKPKRSFFVPVISVPVRFSQSESPLTIDDVRAASELVDPSSKDVESPLHTVFHVGSSNLSCQV